MADSCGEKLPLAKKLSSYTYPPPENFSDRVFTAPDFIVEFYTEWDKDNIEPGKPYIAYQPGAEEMKIVRRAMDSIPQKMKDDVGNSFLGIYFIENLVGSAISDFFVDDGKTYSFIIFNPKVLRMGASEWITSKEKSAFILDDPAYDIKIDIGDGESGFYYIFFHEFGHVYDYIKSVTPGEPTMDSTKEYVKSNGSDCEKYPFVCGVWKEYFKPFPGVDFAGRKDITFYGLSDGPKLKISDAPKIYSKLEQSPFVTLYGAQSWMEDFAEYVAMSANCDVMGRPWELTVLKNNEPVMKYKIPIQRGNLEGRAKQVRKVVTGK